jgi:type II secretory pathway pseudopilin PulG
MLMKTRSRQMAGDTIIEVLISIAIASFVVAGAYAMVNRSLRDTQQAQEHSEALQIADTQVEQLNHYIHNTSASVLSTTIYSNTSTKTYYCFNPALSPPKLEKLTAISSLPDSNTGHYDDLTVPGEDCNKTGSVGYRVAFEADPGTDPVSHIDDTYRVYVNWPSINGARDDQVKLVYRTAPW